VNLNETDEIVYYNIGTEELNIIRPLWEKLNKYHEDTSRYFKQRFHTFTFEDRVNKLMKSEKIKITIAKDIIKDKVVGYCISSILKENKSEIESLFVESNYRGKNIGDFLMKDALEWFKEKDIKSISINVAYGNDNAVCFYKKYGFYPSLLKLENL